MAITADTGAISPDEAAETIRRWEEAFTLFEQVDATTFVMPGRAAWPGWPSPRIGGPPMIMSSMLMLSRSLDVTNLHSLKAEFLKLGDPTLPLRYEFAPLRDSRNFTTRRVSVIQEGALCATLTLGFTSQWEGFAHDFVERPEWGDPQSFPEMWVVTNMPARPPDLPVEPRADVTDRSPTLRIYMRLLPGFSADPARRAAVRAGLTDGPAAMTALGYHGYPPGSQASLDHQVWFHRPLSFDGWHLFDLRSETAVGNRALVQGRIWDEDGNLQATMIQEVSHRRQGA